MLPSIPEHSELSATATCTIFRGHGESSLAVIDARIENKLPVTKCYPPCKKISARIVHLLVDYHNVTHVRNALEDSTTPTPDETGYQIKLHWNGDEYAKTNRDDTRPSNSTGKVTPPFENGIRFLSMAPPEEKEDEVTIAFLNQFPAGYNIKDRASIRKQMLTEEVMSLQEKHSTKHVYLYIAPIFADEYKSLVLDFESMWKEVIEFDSYAYFTNDFFGKKMVGVAPLVKYSISFNTPFYNRYLHVDVLDTTQLDQIKMRNWTKKSFSHLDVSTKSLLASNRIMVLVHDTKENPCTTIWFNGQEIKVRVAEMDSGVMVDSLLRYYEFNALETHDLRKEWIKTHRDFTTSFQIDQPLLPYFSMKNEHPVEKCVLNYVCDTIHSDFNLQLQKFYSTDFQQQRSTRTKKSTYESPPPHPIKLTYCGSVPSSSRDAMW